MARLPDRDPNGIQIQRLNTPHGLPGGLPISPLAATTWPGGIAHAPAAEWRSRSRLSPPPRRAVARPSVATTHGPDLPPEGDRSRTLWHPLASAEQDRPL